MAKWSECDYYIRMFTMLTGIIWRTRNQIRRIVYNKMSAGRFYRDTQWISKCENVIIDIQMFIGRLNRVKDLTSEVED